MIFLLFFLNPLLFLFYCLFKKNIRRSIWDMPKLKFLFIISLSIIGTYYHYAAGDLQRYGFKYYEVKGLPWVEAAQKYLPPTDALYYNLLHLFSYIGLPFSVFIIFINFFCFYLVLKIINEINPKNKMEMFLLLYSPFLVSYSQRFPLACYLQIFAILKLERFKYRYLILIILSFFIHKGAAVILFFYICSILLHKMKINKFFLAMGVFILSFLSFNSIQYFYQLLPNVYFIEKANRYKNSIHASYSIFFSEISFFLLFYIIAMLFAYIFFITEKNINKDKIYYFLVCFGAFILSFIQIATTTQRYTWVFNIIYVIYCYKYQVKISRIFKLFFYFYLMLNLLILFYYDLYLYPKKYKLPPRCLYPTLLQISGYNNKEDQKIKYIESIYPYKKQQGNKITIDLDKYYK